MYCSKCKLTVVVLQNGEIAKACECEAPVIADMEATVKQQSNLE